MAKEITESTAEAQPDPEPKLEAGAGSGEDEHFEPLTFSEAVKSFFRPLSGRIGRAAGGSGSRPKARPASGSAEEARAVNYVDQRERLIAGFLAVFQATLGVATYLHDRSLVVQPSKKSPRLSAAQAHIQTLNYHHDAPWLLVINLVLAVGIAAGFFSRRRALIGFTILLGGFGMTASGESLFGLVYLGIGLWLIFRAMRRTSAAKSGKPAMATSSSSGSRVSSRPAPGRTPASGTGSTSAPPKPRRPPPPSKRYTPPRQRPAASRNRVTEGSGPAEEKKPRLRGLLGR
jgi:hypothetical protein